MLNSILKNTILLAVLGLLFTSCIKDVDFEQAEDLALSPAIEASVIYFQEPASTFVDDDGVEQIVVRDSVNIEIFNDPFVVDNLIKAEFLFEATNSINRAYEAKVEFFNNIDELQHTFTFGIQESPNNTDVVIEHLEVFENENLDALKATTKLVITLILMPSNDGSSLSQNSPGILELRSKASFFLNIDTSE